MLPYCNFSSISLNSIYGIIDNLLHDTYFIIGHFHYVLSLGAVYTIFASIYNYINLLTSMTYNELLGRLHYTFFFISSTTIFKAHFESITTNIIWELKMDLLIML